jgi:hypothetical protein
VAGVLYGTVNGTTEGDLMACGQAVVIDGRVADDVRIAGMALRLGSDAEVAGDLLAAGLSLETEPRSGVFGSLVTVGYQALLAGSIGEDLSAATDAIELRGSVGRNVEAETQGEGAAPPFLRFIPSPIAMPTVQPGLTVAATASIGGNLDYTASTEGRIAEGATISGSITRTEAEAEARPKPAPAERLLTHLRRLIALFVVGLVLVWLAPGWVRRLADTMKHRPLPSLGWGLAGLIGVPIVMVALIAIIAFIAVAAGLLSLGRLVALVIGLGLLSEGAVAVGFWITLAFLAHVVVGFLLGRLSLERMAPGRAGGRVLPLLVGLVILAVLGAVPVLGALVRFVVALLGLGVVCLWLSSRRRQPAAATDA